MSPEPGLAAVLTECLSHPQDARLAAYLAFRPGRTMLAGAIAKCVDLDIEGVEKTLEAWAARGLPLSKSAGAWSWADISIGAGEALARLKALVQDHKPKFEIQEVLAFLESETQSRGGRR